MQRLETQSLDTSNLGGEIGGISNVTSKQDSILTYQGTTEQPYQPLTRGEIASYQGMGALMVTTALLVVWGLNKYFNRLINGSNFKDFTSK